MTDSITLFVKCYNAEFFLVGSLSGVVLANPVQQPFSDVNVCVTAAFILTFYKVLFAKYFMCVGNQEPAYFDWLFSVYFSGFVPTRQTVYMTFNSF